MTIFQMDSRFKGAVDELLVMLDKELVYADEILVLLEEELQALIDMDMSALVSLSKKKMNQMLRMQRLDSSVQEKINAVQARNGTRGDEKGAASGEKIVDISSVADLLEAGIKEKLWQKKEALREKRRAIADKNYINKRMVEDSLGYLNDAISLLTTRPDESGYGKRKTGKKTSCSPAFLSRAV